MFPISDNIPGKKFPVVNWGIIVFNLLVFILELSLNEKELKTFFYHLGLVPARYFHPEWALKNGLSPDNYWPFLSNIFIHGGWAHFLANMWTLYIFGDNVEDRMGRKNYLLFYILCGFMAGFTHFYLFRDSTVPALGASGAISGIMAAYMFLYPHSRIVFVVPLLFIPFFFEIPAFFYIGFWFLSQFFSGTVSLISSANASGIAFWAHIGGFIAGILTFRLFIKKGSNKK